MKFMNASASRSKKLRFLPVNLQKFLQKPVGVVRKNTEHPVVLFKLSVSWGKLAELLHGLHLAPGRFEGAFESLVRWTSKTCQNTVTLSLPSSKIHSPNLLQRERISDLVRIGGIIIFHMKTQVPRTVWCNIHGEAAGEIWDWSPLGVEGLKADIRRVQLGWRFTGRTGGRTACGTARSAGSVQQGRPTCVRTTRKGRKQTRKQKKGRNALSPSHHHHPPHRPPKSKNEKGNNENNLQSEKKEGKALPVSHHHHTSHPHPPPPHRPQKNKQEKATTKASLRNLQREFAKFAGDNSSHTDQLTPPSPIRSSYLARGGHPHGPGPVVVQVGEFVGQSVDTKRAQR